ncbi:MULTISPECIES: helix-turn-helix transcriptional regulator [unclassified Enterococcus]|uniref:helix-turn-helix transcriptional regulator n=1 Tax=unclassified Enterococcus TaxID=2608891 RepID=UPI001CE070B2|nr:MULTISPECIES: helix-turn-helix domain-containing protein [unclassified Enterococcus]MCA5014537.1 helix-turn-helix domain-containing protein [Enterococcus sp. S23]MCA5017790.1 helix-turn-helix domain-containing protein [Enterococcus sp. S22(2020)]
MFQMFKKRKPTNDVKFLRDQKGISQEELARTVETISKKQFGKATPLSVQTVKAIEEYRYMPTFGLAQLIAEALDEDLETVFNKIK